MVHIKTKEGASLWIALLATAIVAVGMVIQHIEWWITLCTSVGVFVVVALAALFIIRKYVAYKLKPIYSIVLSRDVHTNEIFSELKDKRVENIGEELTAWADTNDREIARLKEAECFRKQYLGNVAHELKTPIFNIQGYISTLLDGGLGFIHGSVAQHSLHPAGNLYDLAGRDPERFRAGSGAESPGRNA